MLTDRWLAITNGINSSQIYLYGSHAILIRNEFLKVIDKLVLKFTWTSISTKAITTLLKSTLTKYQGLVKVESWPVEQNRKTRSQSTHTWILIYDRGSVINIGKRKTSSLNAAGTITNMQERTMDPMSNHNPWSPNIMPNPHLHPFLHSLKIWPMQCQNPILRVSPGDTSNTNCFCQSGPQKETNGTLR